MKLVDPSIEVVACGSSGHQMPTFGYWESTVLEHAYDEVDYVSLHAYYQEHDGDRDSFLASGAGMDRFIDDVVATVDAVAARKHRRRRLGLSFDEWNVWYQSRFAGPVNTDVDVPGPAHRGRLQQARRRGRRRPAGQPAQPLRPGARGLPGPAGQRHRPDHDRARRRGLAPVDLLPGRHHRSAPREATASTSASPRPRPTPRLHDDVPTVAAAATHDPGDRPGRPVRHPPRRHRHGRGRRPPGLRRLAGALRARRRRRRQGPAVRRRRRSTRHDPSRWTVSARRQARPRFACHPSPGPRWSSTRPEAPRADRREARTLEGGRAMTAGHQPRAAVPVSRRQLLRGASALAIGGALGTSLSGCADSALSGLSVSHRAAGSLSYWNLFGGGDGIRMQTMEDGFRKANPADRAQRGDPRLGQPVLHQAVAGHARPEAARRRRRPPDPHEDAGRRRPAGGAATRRPGRGRHHPRQAHASGRGRPAWWTGRPTRSRSTPTRSCCSTTPRSAKKAGLLDSDGTARRRWRASRTSSTPCAR